MLILYLIEKVEVYDVNGYKLCAKSNADVDKYLEDVPTEYVKNKDYIKEGFVILTEREVEGFYCKELEHLKINRILTTEEEAELYRWYVIGKLA